MSRERHFSTDFRSLTLRHIDRGLKIELITPNGRRIAIFDWDEEREAEEYARAWVSETRCVPRFRCGACVFCLVGQLGPSATRDTAQSAPDSDLVSGRERALRIRDRLAGKGGE